jgi:hypothetical protein
MRVPVNRGGPTPTTVKEVPLMDRTTPTTAGLPPKRRCQ